MKFYFFIMYGMKYDYGGSMDVLVVIVTNMIVGVFEWLLIMFSMMNMNVSIMMLVFVILWGWVFLGFSYNMNEELNIMVTSMVSYQMILCFGGIMLFESCLFMGEYWLLWNVVSEFDGIEMYSCLMISLFDETLMPASMSLEMLLMVTLMEQWIFSLCIMNMVYSVIWMYAIGMLMVLMMLMVILYSSSLISYGWKKESEWSWSNVIYESGLNFILLEGGYMSELSIINILGLISMGMDCMMWMFMMFIYGFNNNCIMMVLMCMSLGMMNGSYDLSLGGL